jgi:2-dehydro-3-deoxygalactonokinase
LTLTALIALDWGTSNLRASLLDAAGQTTETRSAPGGVMAVKNGAFSTALRDLCGDWLQQFDCPVIASGMIGSRQGWKEAPYLACPARITELAARMTTVAIDGVAAGTTTRMLHIAPGLQCTDARGEFDVLRGEETQIWGAGLPGGSCCVLPGTHSKWAWVGNDGDIARFSTFMTGELYGLLTQHGILGRLMVFGNERRDDFVSGVKLGLGGHAQLSHTIFAARTAGLMGRVAPEGLPDYLSGILIGAEIGGATAGASPTAQAQVVTLIGDDDLCLRYELAFAVKGMTTRRAGADSTTRGQWMIARAAGLLAVRT